MSATSALVQGEEIGGLHPQRFVVGARLEHDGALLRQPPVAQHAVACGDAERRNCAQLVHRVGQYELGFAREPRVLVAKQLSHLVQIEVLGRRKNRASVTVVAG